MVAAGICPGMICCCICWARAFLRARWFRPLISNWSFRCCGGWKYLQAGFSRLHRPCKFPFVRYFHHLFAKYYTALTCGNLPFYDGADWYGALGGAPRDENCNVSTKKVLNTFRYGR